MLRLLLRRPVRDGCTAAVLLLSALALLRFPQDAMDAARTGLQLCCNVIIPSLFPFFILSSLVVELGLAVRLGRLLQPVMRPLFRVNGACASALVLGFIGGYPVGAKTAISLYEKGLCSKTEAERLMAFCNNSGPAFILGVVGAGVFSSSRVGITLCLVHFTASLLVGVLFRFYGGGAVDSRRAERVPTAIRAVSFPAALTGCVKSGFFSVLNICAFVVFFNIVIRLLTLTGILTGAARFLALILSPLGLTEFWAQKLLTGVIEISSGVWSLSGLSPSGGVPMAAFLLGWAGVSVHFQVLSFMDGSGLNLRSYLFGKILHAGISAVLVWALFRLFPQSAPVSSYLATQVLAISHVPFGAALSVSLCTAAAAGALFLLPARRRQIGGGKSRRTGV